MVSDNLVQGVFLGPWGGDSISDDDLELVLNGSLEAIVDRFRFSTLLPRYLSEAEQRAAYYVARGVIDREHGLDLMHRVNDAAKARFQGDGREAALRTECEVTAFFLRLAFRLSELLQNDDERPITTETLYSLGMTYDDELDPDGWTAGQFSYRIPPCLYLQFVSDGCDRLRRYSINYDCNLSCEGEEDDNDPVVGWSLSESGAILTFTVHGIPVDKDGTPLHVGNNTPRIIVNRLLVFLLDLHLHDIQMVTYDVGKQAFVATHALAQLWDRLREKIEGGRAFTCRVCGKRLIAHDERKDKARYCKPGGGCAQAFSRTRRFLSLVSEGATATDAVKNVGNLSLGRALAIVARNRPLFEAEYPGVDFDVLLEG